MIKQINNYAMQNGVVLGLFGIATLAAFKWSLSMPFMGVLFEIMLIASPVVATFLTIKYRKTVIAESESFSFTHGFLHALFTGFYASIWIALIVFIYLSYFDNGSIFAAYEQMLNTPATQEYLRQSGMNAQLMEITGESGIKGLTEAIQSIPPTTYAALFLYLPLIVGPFISAIIGLICRRAAR